MLTAVFHEFVGHGAHLFAVLVDRIDQLAVLFLHHVVGTSERLDPRFGHRKLFLNDREFGLNLGDPDVLLVVGNLVCFLIVIDPFVKFKLNLFGIP